MALDIEDPSPTHQEMEMGDGNCTDHGQRLQPPPSSRCFRIAMKALKYLTYALFVSMYVVITALPVAVVLAQSGDITPDSIAKASVASLVSLPFQKMVTFSWPEMTGVSPSPQSEEGPLMEGIYNQSMCTLTMSRRMMVTSSIFLARAGLLFSAWLATTVTVPQLKRLELLGSPVWKWSLLAVTVTAGYFQADAIYGMPCLALECIASVFERPRTTRLPHKYYYYGLYPAMIMMMYLGMVLLAWLLYFSTESGLKHASLPHPEAFQYVTWTLISLFVGSVLCLCKTLLILKWSANAIYSRFQPRILITTVKYFYLGLTVGKFFMPSVVKELQVVEEYARHSTPTKFNFTKYIMSKDLDVSYLRYVGQILTSLAALVKTQDDDGVPLVIEHFETITRTNNRCEAEDLVELLNCDEILPPKDRVNIHIIRWTWWIIGFFERKYGRSAQNVNTANACNTPSKVAQISPEDYGNNIAKVLYGIMVEQDRSSSDSKFITLDDFKKWMVDAHVNCVNMGRTLSDANAMVTRLDIFISFIIFIVVVLLWLLITGFATTTVLVTIATPMLALTFIFGDSAKTFFQGIIFCFATHAFDVGDRYILDNIELEVKNIGILTTTFIKIGSTEKRMYPNSALATKAIVNHGWQPDPSDTIELTLDFSTTRTVDWEMLENKINQFFNEAKQREFFQSSHEVTMKEVEDKIKVIIHFKHVLNIKEMTHGQCFLKKNKQRSIILKKINYFLDNSPVQNEESGSSENYQVVPITDLDQLNTTSEIAEC